MDKLKMHSDNGVVSNIAIIAKFFPNCITETKDSSGNIKHAVDFDKLKAELADNVAPNTTERYQFTWPDKFKASYLANTPTTSTLRPCRAESVDFDRTKNLYIEGDNLEVLKVLRHTYAGKVKMIYIDPPYNTGNDFVYEDDFAIDANEYQLRSGQKDNEGNRLVANKESNGRFHTDWLNMIYPRLKLARELLSEEGVLFISIDDYEVDRLALLCGEIFGENNIVSKLIWKKKQGGGNDSGHVVIEHEYILVVAKNIEQLNLLLDKTCTIDQKTYPFADQQGRYGLVTLDKSSIQISESLIFEIKGPDGTIYTPRVIQGKQSCWRWSQAKVKKDYQQLVFKNGKVYTKFYMQDGQKPRSLLIADEYGRTASGGNDLKKIFGTKPFSYPKPVSLIKHLISIVCREGIVLDFFSGSATTAQAVMELNAEDQGQRQFIMIQLPEKIAADSEAFAAGYHNICEIGKERIRRVGEALNKEHGSLMGNLDTGFRVLKLDSSNMEDTFYKSQEYTQASLFEDNIKSDRTSEDLLFQAMLETGALLYESIEILQLNKLQVFNVAQGYLLACFDKHLDLDSLTQIAKHKPLYFICRDASLTSDAIADNIDQVFKAYTLTPFAKCFKEFAVCLVLVNTLIKASLKMSF